VPQDNSSIKRKIVASAARFTATVHNDRLLLADESNAFIVEGAVYVDIVRIVSGGVSLEDLPSLLPDYSLDEIRAAIVHLANVGFLRPTLGSNFPERDAWWESASIEKARRSLELRTLCSEGAAMLRQALESIDLSIDEGADLLVVTTDDYLRPELADINRRGNPWLLAKPVGHTIFLGPLFIPRRTACWECVAWWLQAYRWRQSAFHGWQKGQYPPQPSIACLPATLAIAAGMIATASAMIAARGNHEELENAILAFDTRTLQLSRHEVNPVPGCPICGGASTVRPLKAFVSDVIGPMSRLESCNEAEGGLFHAKGEVIYPLPRVRVSQILKPTSVYGKGGTKEEAQNACIAEGLERYSSVYQGDEPVVRAKAASLETVDVPQLLLFSEAQYGDREIWNVGHPSTQFVPQPFDGSAEIGWAPAVSLDTGITRFVPAGFVYAGYPLDGEHGYCIPDSNGCAAGQSIEEAKCSAVFELIERDALAIWWYNRVRRPSVRLELFGDTRIDGILAAFARLGRSVYLLDITTDLGIPVYVALAPTTAGTAPLFGAAAHVCARTAAFKALSEMAQVWFWNSRAEYGPEMRSWLQTAALPDSEFSYLRPAGAVDPDPAPWTGHEAAVSHCVSRLRIAGIEAYSIDLTRPEIRLPVVRVVAPGLRHMWPRYAPGRLYDIPVSLGWVKQATTESQLNPIACML